MGWNTICTASNYKLHDDINDNWFYFVHSYFAPVSDHTIAITNHGLPFSAMVQSRNFTGAQFHPERSAQAGAALLKRFLDEAA